MPGKKGKGMGPARKQKKEAKKKSALLQKAWYSDLIKPLNPKKKKRLAFHIPRRQIKVIR